MHDSKHIQVNMNALIWQMGANGKGNEMKGK